MSSIVDENRAKMPYSPSSVSSSSLLTTNSGIISNGDISCVRDDCTYADAVRNSPKITQPAACNELDISSDDETMHEKQVCFSPRQTNPIIPIPFFRTTIK